MLYPNEDRTWTPLFWCWLSKWRILEMFIVRRGLYFFVSIRKQHAENNRSWLVSHNCCCRPSWKILVVWSQWLWTAFSQKRQLQDQNGKRASNRNSARNLWIWQSGSHRPISRRRSELYSVYQAALRTRNSFYRSERAMFRMWTREFRWDVRDLNELHLFFWPKRKTSIYSSSDANVHWRSKNEL